MALPNAADSEGEPEPRPRQEHLVATAVRVATTAGVMQWIDMIGLPSDKHCTFAARMYRRVVDDRPKQQRGLDQAALELRNKLVARTLTREELDSEAIEGQARPVFGSRGEVTPKEVTRLSAMRERLPWPHWVPFGTAKAVPADPDLLLELSAVLVKYGAVNTDGAPPISAYVSAGVLERCLLGKDAFPEPKRLAIHPSKGEYRDFRKAVAALHRLVARAADRERVAKRLAAALVPVHERVRPHTAFTGKRQWQGSPIADLMELMGLDLHGSPERRSMLIVGRIGVRYALLESAAIDDDDAIISLVKAHRERRRKRVK